MTTTSELLTTVANNTPLVYEAGYKEGLANSKSSEWKKLISITTEEEVNEINVSHEDFPKCKEFIVRAVFQKSATGEDIVLGRSYIYFNDNKQTAYSFGSNTINKSVVTEGKVHITIADKLIYSVGASNIAGQALVTTAASTLIGERYINSDVTNIIYKINDNTKVFPIGTKFYVYGKVEG